MAIDWSDNYPYSCILLSYKCFANLLLKDVDCDFRSSVISVFVQSQQLVVQAGILELLSSAVDFWTRISWSFLKFRVTYRHCLSEILDFFRSFASTMRILSTFSKAVSTLVVVLLGKPNISVDFDSLETPIKTQKNSTYLKETYVYHFDKFE